MSIAIPRTSFQRQDAELRFLAIYVLGIVPQLRSRANVASDSVVVFRYANISIQSRYEWRTYPYDCGLFTLKKYYELAENPQKNIEESRGKRKTPWIGSPTCISLITSRAIESCPHHEGNYGTNIFNARSVTGKFEYTDTPTVAWCTLPQFIFFHIPLPWCLIGQWTSSFFAECINRSFLLVSYGS